jgi:hypothetical protein
MSFSLPAGNRCRTCAAAADMQRYAAEKLGAVFTGGR